MSIDKETEFTEDNIKDIKLARKNKEIFMMNYAIEFQVPCIYVKSANFYPKDTTYFIKTELYVIPKDKNNNMTLISHNMVG